VVYGCAKRFAHKIPTSYLRNNNNKNSSYNNNALLALKFCYDSRSEGGMFSVACPFVCVCLFVNAIT